MVRRTPHVDRRTFLAAGIVLPIALVACSDGDSGTEQASSSTSSSTTADSAGVTALAPTPSCADGGATAAQTEGPFFTPDSPLKPDLYADVGRGTRLVVSGSVLNTACRPIPRAIVDVWQADDEGTYDNDSFRLRGHVLADAEGKYRFTTLVPGEYAGRTRHLHVKVAPPNSRTLTTQLYFPNDSGNARDGIYRRELEMRIRDAGNSKEGTFDFVVEA